MNPSLNVERKGVALYIQIASLLRGRIQQGEWKRGNQLPPIPALCAFYNVGTITVRQALAELSAEGLISSARGRGTFVTADVVSAADNAELRDAINDPLSLAPGQTIKLLLREPADGLPATLKTGQPEWPAYMRIRTIHLHDGEPYAVMDAYVARETCDRFPKGSEGRHKVGYLVRKYNRIPLDKARQEITAAYADQETAGLLASRSADCSMADVLMRARRWWTDRDGRIVHAGLYLYRADMFVLDVTHDISGDDRSADLIPVIRNDAAQPSPAPRRKTGRRPAA
ncbi:GntR family transcriptional regulator [Burkholderia sp. Ac-20353]|uniref:GntR family transcriptional regulator n=1 Tax=Burkholderia sp. Ac-20353 TaxID=2703894 RepID=UPI00197BCEC1|nr:GntR family transcriptional regulator [Burkholderia sp. Ac-20353]MBN3787555.1 GntR family transcriptional regulator [Burkholderia sp. Ac-20353]